MHLVATITKADHRAAEIKHNLCGVVCNTSYRILETSGTAEVTQYSYSAAAGWTMLGPVLLEVSSNRLHDFTAAIEAAAIGLSAPPESETVQACSQSLTD